MQASGEVYNLRDLSQFSGPWIQGTGSLAVTAKANGEIWLENRNGVIMRLNAAQAGLTFSRAATSSTSSSRNSGALRALLSSTSFSHRTGGS